VILALLNLLGCSTIDEDAVPLHFDGPVAAAVLPDDVGPFEVPTGYVANSRSGTIVPLDLKMGRLLSDDPLTSFTRSAAVTTGHARLLADVAAVAGDDGSVTLWAVDSAFVKLVRAPYVLSVDDDGFPVEFEPTATDPVFVDADGSGDSPTLDNLTVRSGFTTTEDWSIEYDGTRWWAKGSRSGTMQRAPVAGETYLSDNGEIEFDLSGSATLGDRFQFSTDTGLIEYDLGGYPTAVFAQGGRVYVSVASDDAPRIVVYDGVTGAYAGAIDLDAGAQPARMTAAPDGRLFVADGALPQVWAVRFDQDPDPATAPVETIAIAAPAVDVAWQGGEDAQGVAFDHLFVAPLGLLRVDVWDLATSTWVDPNPMDAETEGVFLGSPVSGLAASAGDVWMEHPTDWGGHARIPTVTVATSNGFAYQLEGSTGCAVMDERGPHGPNALYDTTEGYATFADQGDVSTVSLWIDDSTGDQIVPSDCGGVTRSETWTVTYNSASADWKVEGTLSGVQETRAVEDVRYVSDNGAVSFLLSPGSLPATDGDQFLFTTDNGLLVFSGTDENEDGTVDALGYWQFPGRPVGFEVHSGPTGGGWDPYQVRQYALLPVVNSDFAARLHLDSGKTEVVYK
jgi:hypothetical protein